MRRGTLTTGRAFAIAATLLATVAVLFLVVGALALNGLQDARVQLVDRVDPARVAGGDLTVALLDEETGVRGYVLTARESFLEPFRRGERAERDAQQRLSGRIRQIGDPAAAAALRRVLAAADRWRETYARPAIAAARRGDAGSREVTTVTEGKARFDRVRAALRGLQSELQRVRTAARADLRDNARTVNGVVYGFGILLLLSLVITAVGLRRGLTAPLGRLGRQVRTVADGDFAAPVTVAGLADIRRLGQDVDSMRERIVLEVDRVRAANEELQEQQHALERSNAELEQFAYVASHDLQEPLRKIASFGQLLQRRYGGQLDERADQYLEFQVDGARRMQTLINDLLAFSRVGRLTDAREAVDLTAVVAQVQLALAAAVEESGARIEVGDLPVVQGEPGLLTLLLQNLVANGIKFRRPDVPPRIVLSARVADGMHEITCADNGIGIEEEYAERIFVIFQRLHTREAYEGTGIGLSLCRKIVEHHGGRIWLDTTAPGPGTTLRFTLPIDQEPTP